MSNKSVDFVNVSVRIKPCVKTVSSSLDVINNDPPLLLVVDKSQIYHFDNIFTADVNQKHIYNETVKPLVDHVKNGYNCTVFAYGQTGTGKTYTMGTNPDIIRCEEDTGLISRALEDFFSLTNDDEEVEIYISFIEIYNEKVFDLLSTSKVPLSIKGFTVHGFEKNRIYDTYTALLHLASGGRNRHTGETKQNFSSSRSHAIFTIHYHWRNSEKEIAAKLNLVDLAGSESVRKTGNQGSSLNEGININKGLLSLGQVMTALSNNSTHVPYRQSVITTILQDSLNKKNYISLIACVSSNTEDLGETLQTLEFSQRVKRIKNKPEINHFITQYKRENLSLAQSKGSTPLKRSNDLMYETPFKKPRSFMPVITESSISSNLHFDNSKSSFSSSVYENPQQNLSPVIKKYMNAMEESLMNKLEDVIKSSLRRSTRLKLMNKENVATPVTPSFSWDKITKIVRSEVLQLTNQVSRATSSPIEENWPKPEKILNDSNNELRLKPRKLLADDVSSLSFEKTEDCTLKNEPVLKRKRAKNGPSPVKLADDVSSLSFEETENYTLKDEAVFKVPALPAPVPKQKRAKNDQSPVKRRSSMRLQNKKQQEECTNRRRSVRLQVKAANDQRDSDIQLVSKTQRISRKSVKSNITLLKNSNVNNNDSPITVRTKQVLNILNMGTVRDIATLHTIGAKTAEKILLFRQLKGNFESISNLSSMPYWTKNKYQKFLAENFLRDEKC